MTPELDLDALKPVLAAHSINLLVLFGSRARGTERPTSDLDLGAQRQDGRPMQHRQLGMLQNDLSVWAALPVDVLDLASADAIVRFEVCSQGRVLYTATPHVWTDFVARTLIDHDDIAVYLPALRAGIGRAARRGSTR